MSTQSNTAYFEQQEIKAAEKYMGVDGKETTKEEKQLADAAALKKAQAEISGKIFRERLLMVGLIAGLAFLLIKITE